MTWHKTACADTQSAFAIEGDRLAVWQDDHGDWHAGEMGLDAQGRRTCDCALCPMDGHDMFYSEAEARAAVEEAVND